MSDYTFSGVFKIYSTKGQLNVEYFVSIIVFIVFTMYILFEMIRFIPLYISEIDREILRSEAYQLSEILTNDAGKPLNWPSQADSNIKRIGLSDDRENRTNILSMAKITSFNSKCFANYNQVARWLDMYDYFSVVIIDSTTSNVIANCQPPAGIAAGITNTTVRRLVAFDSGNYGELILNVW